MLRRVGFAFLTLVIICAAFGWVPVCAQRITGDIAGDLTDSTGAVVAGAAITLENVGTKLTRTTTANEAENFRINDPPIGTYRVAVSAPGFKTTERKAEVVAPGSPMLTFIWSGSTCAARSWCARSSRAHNCCASLPTYTSG